MNNFSVRKLLWFILFSLVSCKSSQGNRDSNLQTDFGPDGNFNLQQTFSQYVKKEHHCVRTNGVPRVIISGFGLFSGLNYNISGNVVAALSDESFIPSDLSRIDRDVPNSEWTPNSKLTGDDFGGRIVQRRFSFGQKQVDVCAIILDVRWDLAGAIALHEASLFEPDFIFLTGVGGGGYGVFEHGALNKTSDLSGFSSEGDRLVDNIPWSEFILEEENGKTPKSTIQMTWDGQKLASNANLRASELRLSYRIKAESYARSNNDYICNNTSYVVLHALDGFPVKLAGKMIDLSQLNVKGRAGFFHFPGNSKNDATEIWKWAVVILTAASEA